MLRLFLAATMTLTSLSAFAGDVALTGKTLVRGETVILGDLFTNTGSHQDHVLASAPAVGDRLELGKSDLLRVAKAFHLDWDVPEHDVTASLERDAVAVTKEDIVQALEKSDLQDKLSANASFNITSLANPIVIDGREVPELSVSDTSFDPATEKFAAKLIISRDGTVLKETAVSGVATAMANVPALARAISSGSVISSSDIIELSVPASQVKDNVILNREELIGMVPKRNIQPNRPITSGDITPPVLVKRNELVNVTYQNGPIILNTKARALANGARGETITLLNPNSKSPFEAVITGPQQAEIIVARING